MYDKINDLITNVMFIIHHRMFNTNTHDHQHRPRHGASHGLQNGGLFTFADYEVSLCYVRWLVYLSVMNSRYSSLHVNLLRKT